MLAVFPISSNPPIFLLFVVTNSKIPQFRSFGARFSFSLRQIKLSRLSSLFILILPQFQTSSEQQPHQEMAQTRLWFRLYLLWGLAVYVNLERGYRRDIDLKKSSPDDVSDAFQMSQLSCTSDMLHNVVNFRKMRFLEGSARCGQYFPNSTILWRVCVLGKTMNCRKLLLCRKLINSLSDRTTVDTMNETELPTVSTIGFEVCTCRDTNRNLDVTFTHTNSESRY